jgi:hypothetical protein
VKLSAICQNQEPNVIRYECGQVKAELRPDAEGNLKIYKILEDKY